MYKDLILKNHFFLSCHKFNCCRYHETGEVIGKHRGLWYHTVGQRKGIGIRFSNLKFDKFWYMFVGQFLDSRHLYAGPWFVAGKDMERNILYLSNNSNVSMQHWRWQWQYMYSLWILRLFKTNRIYFSALMTFTGFQVNFLDFVTKTVIHNCFVLYVSFCRFHSWRSP